MLGVQGHAWTEYMRNPKEVEFKIFPRILALSEVAWCDPEKKNGEYGEYEKFK